MDDTQDFRLLNLEQKELLATIPLIEGLPRGEIASAFRHAVTRDYLANQIILLEDDWGGSVYFILKGWVKIRTHNTDGKEVTLNIVGPGEVVGEMAAIAEVPRSTDVIALTKTTATSIPAQDFVAFLHSQPLASIRLAQLMAKRLRHLNRRLRLRESDSLSRVADTLLFLAEGQGKVGNQGTEIPNFPHREISSISGLARETVTRSLAKLEKKGLIIRENDSLCIVDLLALEQVIV
jgi:CRP-like cAMP-binding protein